MTLKKNFTLIELIVSIVVIGILAAIVMLNISDLRLQAEETAYAVNSKEVQTAVDRYKLEHGEYPSTPQPSKDNPQLVEMDKIVPEFIRKEPKGDFPIEVDEKGKIIIKRGETTPEESGSGGGEGSEGLPVATTPVSCPAAEAEGYICIYTPEEFDAIRNDMEGKYILMEDISLAAYDNWISIGNYANPFKGVLNGNGKKITNLTLGEVTPNEDYGKGLFGLVTSGEFKNISLVDVMYADGITVMDYGSFLVSQVYSDAGNNPAELPLTFSNISLSGTAKHIDGFGPLVSDLYSNQTVVIKDIYTNVQVEESVVLGAGLAYNYTATDLNSSISVQGIEVNGSIYARDVANGMFVSFDNQENNLSPVFEDIVVNASLSADDNVAGFVDYFYIYNNTGSLVARNIHINGDIIHRSGGYSDGDASGFATEFSVEGSNSSLLENITITSKVSSPNRVSGFANSLAYFYTDETHTVQNLSITSNMTGANVNLFSNGIESYGLNNLLAIKAIDINATVTHVGTPTIGSGAFASEIFSTDGIGNYEFTDIEVISNLVYSDVESEFVPSVTNESLVGKILFNNISINGTTASFEK